MLVKLFQILSSSILLLALLPSLARAADAPADAAPVDLLSYSVGDNYWIGVVGKIPNAKGKALFTRILVRESGSGQRWREFTTISARLLSLTQRGSQLAAMMEGGRWILIWPTGQSDGSALPLGRLLAIAGDGENFWGLADIPGGAKAFADLPATRPTSQSLTTMPAKLPNRLVLLSLDRSVWQVAAELPEAIQIAPDHADAVLAVVNRNPVIAVRDGPKSIRVARFTSQKIWLDLNRIESTELVKDFSLVSAPAGALAWLAPDAGPGRIHRTDPLEIPLQPLQTSRPFPAASARSVTLAGERLRLLFNLGPEIFEQKYQFDGTPIGDAEPIKVPEIITPSPLLSYISMIVMGALLFTIVSAIRHRPEVQATLDAEKPLPLAGLGRRLAAGLVDAAPVLVTVIVLINRSGADALAQLDIKLLPPLAIAVGVYIGHVTIAELIWAKSIGKFLFGLRVTDLQGRRASVKSILLRNLLRIIDLWLLIPLILILYSPLRQRAADMAAGTVVLGSDAEK